jgi:hypothetical protein
MRTTLCRHSLASGLLLSGFLGIGRLGTLTAAGQAPAVLETPAYRLEVNPGTGSYEIRDKQASQVWRSNPFQARFGEIAVNRDGKVQRLALDRPEIARTERQLELTFRPLAGQNAAVKAQLRSVDAQTLEISYAADETLGAESIRLLEDAFWTTDQEGGYVVVPVREGLLVPADSGLSFMHRFDTFAYEGCHMEMLGVVKNGAALLASWHDPYVTAEVRSTVTNLPAMSGRQVLSPSLVLRKSARSIRLQFLGAGDYVKIARAYRPIAQAKGWVVPWSEKLKGHPERAKLLGAVNYKLWSTLSRRMNEDSTKEESSRVNWTFEEAAQIAEHLKRDLGLEKVLFMIGGWIRRGYDNQHPDILPTAPECGGDAAFRDCAERVMRLGYVFCLHDNYQDIYRDSPSWSEDYIMRNADGGLVKGGHWAGGRAYLTCSKKALELAQRPQNLAAVKKLSGANSYFIDTTYAAGLLECFDPKHPLTRWDDMKWKQAISDYAREVFGIFGSECGREWAIPHSDFFEGLTGVSGTYYHNKDLVKTLGAAVVPLFEMVYRDCIALYGKYGYDAGQAAEYVLHHLALGRPLHYHSVPSHLYWQGGETNATPPGARAGVFTRGDNGWSAGLHRMDRFVKNTYEMLAPLYEITAQMPMTSHRFVTPDRRVQHSVFGSGPATVHVIVNGGTNHHTWRSAHAGEVVLPQFGFLVESSRFIAFHALNWDGVRYEEAPLFTMRSEDGQPLEKAARIRVFHGFGDRRIKLGGEVLEVERETTHERRIKS